MRKRSPGSLSARDLGSVLAQLQRTNGAVARAFPGETGERQPVHTVYGGAHIFKSDTAARLGRLALAALDEYAPDAATFSRALGLSAEIDAELATLGGDERVRAREIDLLRFQVAELDAAGVSDAGEDG